jgi:hypothetical protein
MLDKGQLKHITTEKRLGEADIAYLKINLVDKIIIG